MVPTMLTESVFSFSSENLRDRATPASMTPCMKSPLMSPSSSTRAIFTPGCSLSVSATASFTLSPMMPDAHEVITAILSYPLAICSSISSLSFAVPPKTMSSSAIPVHTTWGSRNPDSGRLPNMCALLAEADTIWKANWAQLRGECSTVARLGIDAQTLCAPAKAHPVYGSWLSTFLDVYLLALSGVLEPNDAGISLAAGLLRSTDLPSTTDSNSDSDRYLAL